MRFWIVTGHPSDQLAGRRVSGNDHSRNGDVALIKTEVRFSGFFVRSVARVAGVRQDRLNITGVIDVVRQRFAGKERGAEEEAKQAKRSASHGIEPWRVGMESRGALF